MFPCSADHDQDWLPYPVHPYFAESADHSHIYIHICTYHGWMHLQEHYSIFTVSTLHKYIHMYIPRKHLQGHYGMFTVFVLYHHTSNSPTIHDAHQSCIAVAVQGGFGP